MATSAQQLEGQQLPVQSKPMACACSSGMAHDVLCALSCQRRPAAVSGSSSSLSASSCPASPLLELTMDAHREAFGDDFNSRERRAHSRGDSASQNWGSASASTSPLFSSSIARKVLNGNNGTTRCTHSSSSASLDKLWLPQQWKIDGRLGHELDEDRGNLARRIRSLSVRSSMGEGDESGDEVGSLGDRSKPPQLFRRTKSFAIKRVSSSSSWSSRTGGKSLSAKQRQFMRCACGKYCFSLFFFLLQLQLSFVAARTLSVSCHPRVDDGLTDFRLFLLLFMRCCICLRRCVVEEASTEVNS
jgi:hypothetical protein